MKKLCLLLLTLTQTLNGLNCRAIGIKVAEGLTPDIQAGVAELRRYVRLANNSPQNVKEAEQILNRLSQEKTDALIALGNKKLRDKTELPKVSNNLEHVVNQHLKPLESDGPRLRDVFGTDPKKLELLMVAHDLGKVEIPKNMLKALSSLFPGDFVAREILSHEYASMHWIEKLGKEAGLTAKEIFALQTLISNHNFGPDLTRTGNEELQSHWWPSMFRTKFIPKMKSIGIEMTEYGNAEEGAYSSLLSAYDRAIANEFNQFGLATWQKFAEQDYNAWQGNAKSNPTLETPFSGPSLVNRMKISAEWAESEIDSLWQTLKNRYANNPTFDLNQFEPYRKQKEGIQKLKNMIAQLEKINSVAIPGSVNFKSPEGTLYRVDDVSGDLTQPRVFRWTGSEWIKVAEGGSPVKLLFDLMKPAVIEMGF